MYLFSRKHPEALAVEPPTKSRIEIEVHKTANKEAAEKAKRTSKDLNELLVENGFTLKLYMAAGGKPPRKKRVRKVS